jgi:hypothetical protein
MQHSAILLVQADISGRYRVHTNVNNYFKTDLFKLACVVTLFLSGNETIAVMLSFGVFENRVLRGTFSRN